jgi:hypothetical protein
MNNSMNTRQRNFVVGLIVIGLMIISFFGLRTMRAFRQFHGHRPPPPFSGEKAETDVDLIRDWMTLQYISITYRLPPELLYETLKISPKGNERKNLKELNDEYYPQAPGTVLELVKATIRSSQSPPTAVPGDTAVSPPTPVPQGAP